MIVKNRLDCPPPSPNYNGVNVITYTYQIVVRGEGSPTPNHNEVNVITYTYFIAVRRRGIPLPLTTMG